MNLMSLYDETYFQLVTIEWLGDNQVEEPENWYLYKFNELEEEYNDLVTRYTTLRLTDNLGTNDKGLETILLDISEKLCERVYAYYERYEELFIGIFTKEYLNIFFNKD